MATTETATLPLDDLIPLGDLPKLLPASNGRRLAQSTCWRWAIKGLGGTKLKAWRVGGKWYTSAEAVREFGEVLAGRTLEKLNSPVKREFPKPRGQKKRTPEQRAVSIAAAESRLRSRGCM